MKVVGARRGSRRPKPPTDIEGGDLPLSSSGASSSWSSLEDPPSEIAGDIFGLSVGCLVVSQESTCLEKPSAIDKGNSQLLIEDIIF